MTFLTGPYSKLEANIAIARDPRSTFTSQIQHTSCLFQPLETTGLSDDCWFTVLPKPRDPGYCLTVRQYLYNNF